jgi:hypothetical protein
MDSNSDSDSSVCSTGTAAFPSSSTIPVSPNPNDPQYERGPLGEQFVVLTREKCLVGGHYLLRYCPDASKSCYMSSMLLLRIRSRDGPIG